MLSKIEETYLTILRVAVVVVAGLALTLATGALLGSAIYFVRGTTKSVATSPTGAGLGQFVREQKLALGSQIETATVSSPATAKRLPDIADEIDAAAAIFAEYATRKETGGASKSAPGRGAAVICSTVRRSK